mgnify:CR=1 FL=1
MWNGDNTQLQQATNLKLDQPANNKKHKEGTNYCFSDWLKCFGKESTQHFNLVIVLANIHQPWIKNNLIPSIKADTWASRLFVAIHIKNRTYSDYHNRLMLNEQRIMQRKDLPEVMNLKERKTRDFFREMLDNKYITEKNGELFITDNIIYRGEKKERRYNQKMKLFIKTVRDLYKQSFCIFWFFWSK